jgi:hypothetical protein
VGSDTRKNRHNRRPLSARVLAGILVEIIEDGNRRGDFAVDDAPTLARVIQTATMKVCDPRLIAQYQMKHSKIRPAR